MMTADEQSVLELNINKFNHDQSKRRGKCVKGKNNVVGNSIQ